MTENRVSQNQEELKRDLENLNTKIKEVLDSGTSSADGLNALINEAKELQKRIIFAAKTSEDNKKVK